MSYYKENYRTLVKKVIALEDALRDLNLSDLKFHLERSMELENNVLAAAPLKIGDMVRIGKDLGITQESHPGWYGSRTRFEIGKLWKVKDVQVDGTRLRYGCTPYCENDVHDDGLYFIDAQYLQKVKVVDDKELDK